MQEILCEIRDLLIDVRTSLEFIVEKNIDMSKALSCIANRKPSNIEDEQFTVEEIMDKLNFR